MTNSKSSSWSIPTALVVLSIVPLIGGFVRLNGLMGGETVSPANARFVASPAPIFVHIFAASFYSLIGAFQFSDGVRRRWPKWHRYAGRVLAFFGMLAALSGIWMAVAYDIPRPLQGTILMVTRVVVGGAMAAALVLGWRAIMNRDVPNHEAWMIRAYALGQGAGAQVLWLGVPSIFVGEILGPQRDILMVLSWLGNVLVGEWIIRRRYAGARSRKTAAAALNIGS